MRLDGRRPYDLRKVKFEVRQDGPCAVRAPMQHVRLSLSPHCMQFSLDDQSATVHLGSTRVMTVISAQLEPPFADRPSEGSIRFNVELSPMASPAFEVTWGWGQGQQ